MLVRERIEAREREALSQYAALASESRGREHEDEPDPVRTCYQRDRDRILHSKSFRRLKYKTQVFIAPESDHYRTRLTHSLEVAQIGRTIARALRLNEDLTEAIALGHDVGHTPFGHAGESALDEAVRKRDPEMRFRHYEQSLRVLRVLEQDGKGLNLTRETLEGIGGHSKGRQDLTAFDGDVCGSLEGAVVRVADRVAYLNHDLDDALRAKWLTPEQVPKDIRAIGDRHSRRIGAMVEDIIETSLDKPAVRFSDPMLQRVNAMKEFMFDSLYLEYPKRLPEVRTAMGIVRSLFDYCADNPGWLPKRYEGLQGAVDYVSGMTDRYAARKHEEIFSPGARD
ncbi:MAG: deoxyguanosinetriphosphate triphosphohydrolase [Armatimonadetes bacterium]|nr:deoxyguanosinetriphosphate triphosphohydrolase [Armatimonadota bacterium]